MKKIFITVLVALTLVATAEAGHNRLAEPNKPATEQVTEDNSQKSDVNEQNSDENTNSADQDSEDTKALVKIGENVSIGKNGIVVKKDGKTVKVKMDDLDRIISKHLDDTVLSTSDLTVDADNYEGIKVGSAEYNLAQDGMRLASEITIALCIAAVFIVFFALLFYYMHRRRKYKTVDRAIQAGYPLPDEFFGKHTPQIPQQPANVYVTQVTPPPADPNAPQGAQPATGYGYTSSNPLNNITDWTPFKSGIKTTAWGVGLLFFFWILGAEPIAALMLIVIFIGLGKLFTTYQEQQNLKNYWQQQQWTQQAQQAPQAPQQANDVPPNA